MVVRTAVEATPAQPPRYGLLVAAQTQIGDAGRWQFGVAWEPEQCGSSGREAVDCFGSTPALDANVSPGTRTGDPFMVYASDRCSPFGFQARDWAARATRQLEATQSFEVADELWSGTLRDAAGVDDQLADNPALTDSSSDTVTSGAADPIDALACLEQGLSECSRGRRGMIHATPQTLVRWVAAQAVRLEGGQYLSPLGNIVVADAGYDGSGPGGSAAGASQWAYATGLISIRLSTPQVIPGTLENAQSIAQALNREDNTLDVYAQRLALIQWDECCHIAAELDLATCAVGGAS